jgi:alkanesulfonate monooxygenase SsuD/methylene tetrahydromethanopterin reductase-like flavin-dependent oxidoreductase (luciferase family)
MSQALKVGITAWTSREGWRADVLCRQAQDLESRGFHSLWLPENHFGDARSLPSPLTLLAAAAAGTERIHLATTSYLLPIRHPLQAAGEVAVLDQLSNGRVILGVGRGIQDSVFRAFELDPRDKRKRFQANLEVMRNAWRGDPVLDGEGGDPVRLAPLPLQRPHPPIWVAAFGPLALRQAGSLGLPYLASPVESLGALEHNYKAYRLALDEAGLPPVTTVPVMRNVFITEDRSLARDVGEAMQRVVPRAMRERAGNLEDWAIVGDRHYAMDRLGEYAERLGMTHIVARGGISRVPEAEQQRSHDHLLELAAQLS